MVAEKRRDGIGREERGAAGRTMEFREGQGRLESICPLLDGSSRRAGDIRMIGELERVGCGRNEGGSWIEGRGCSSLREEGESQRRTRDEGRSGRARFEVQVSELRQGSRYRGKKGGEGV